MIESLVLDWLTKSVNPRARESGGTFFVEYGRPFKAVAIGAWLIMLTIGVVCFLPSTGVRSEVVLLIACGFFLLALFLHMEFFLVRITYSVAGVEVYSKWGGQRIVGWHEIDAVRFSKPGQNYAVRLHSGETFKFGHFMSGYQSLLDEIQKRTVGSPVAPGRSR